MRFARIIGSAAGVLVGLSCGARKDPGTDGSTHFWDSCARSSECGSARECVCGRCTTECQSSNECAPAGATCVPASTRLDCAVNQLICAPGDVIASDVVPNGDDASVGSGAADLDASVTDDFIGEIDESIDSQPTFPNSTANDTVVESRQLTEPIPTQPQCLDAPGCPWRTLTSPPALSMYAATASLGSRVYLLGGSSPELGALDAGQQLDSFPVEWSRRGTYVYDTIAEQWSALTPLPADVSNGRAAVISDKVYVMDQRLDSPLHIYDTAADAWTTAAQCPGSVDGSGVQAAGDKLYVFGGFANSTDGQNSLSFSNGNLEVFVYDPELDTWVTGEPAPHPTFNPASCVLNGRIYVIGSWIDVPEGESGAWPPAPDGGPFDTRTLIYDTAADSWAYGAPLPATTSRSGHSCATVGEELYMVGGVHEGGAIPVLRYQLANDTWTQVSTVPKVGGSVDLLTSPVQAVGNYLYVHLPQGSSLTERPPFLEFMTQP